MRCDGNAATAVLKLDRAPTAVEIAAQVPVGCEFLSVHAPLLRVEPGADAETLAKNAIATPGAALARLERRVDQAKLTSTAHAVVEKRVLGRTVTAEATFTTDPVDVRAVEVEITRDTVAQAAQLVAARLPWRRRRM